LRLGAGCVPHDLQLIIVNLQFLLECMAARTQLDRPPPIDDSSATVQRLMDQYTEIARLAGGLAHEIKNPLSTIRLNMELLAEDLGEAQTPVQRRAAKRIEIVRRECQRLQSLLDDFLNFAKVRRLHLEPSDLNHEINDVLDFFAPEAKEAGVEIVRYLDADLPRVMIDREAFRQALLNLIINAKQAMQDGGQLIVRTAAEGDTVALYLIDTGCGMDERTASRMFEAFFSTKPGGSGLGLPTTQKIIAALGGRISVQSELGRGTQFTIELPVPARISGTGE
jgi:signal transduction histidine kinase